AAERHRGLVVAVPAVAMPVVPGQRGEAGVERGEVDAVLAAREVLDHVTARARAVSVGQRAEVERGAVVIVSLAMPRGGRRRHDEDVAPRAADEPIAARSAVEDVVAVLAVERIAAGAPEQVVVAGTTEQLVLAAVAVEPVVPAAAVEPVALR